VLQGLKPLTGGCSTDNGSRRNSCGRRRGQYQTLFFFVNDAASK
jgi:hypothetical protein